ncbi:DNA-directed RNA polymerase subunit E'' [Candidatus Woesearchaeota archaeon]|nr:DNA-directed RNA polymerase subunit E'' [Candidatus Woesearchaeota archaeon]
MKRKVCKSCKIFYEEEHCPVCKTDQQANSWKGRIHILNAKESDIAKKIRITKDGEYAIKIG